MDAAELRKIREALVEDAKTLVELRRKILRLKRKQVEQALKAIGQDRPVPRMAPVPYERTIFRATEQLLDRILGKPGQTVKVEGEVSVHHRLAERLEKWRKISENGGREDQMSGGDG